MKDFVIAAGAILTASCLGVNAQDSAGKTEYMVACAVCHGESGKGDGSFSSLMNVPVPNLTTLAAENEGNFPFLKVFMTVDGRTMAEGHGAPMPVWGDRYSADAEGDYGTYGAEVVTRGRILTLVNYLETIQE